MFCVYILQSLKDSSLYIGYTANKEKRLYEHNFGRTGYTVKKRPWKLVYREDFQTRSEALKREKYLKSLKSKIYLQELIHKYLAAL